MLKCDRTQQSQNKTLKNSHNPHFYLFFLFSSPVLGKKGPLLCHSAWRYGLPSGHRKLPLCIDVIFPLWTEIFVNCKRSAPNLVIIMLKPNPFRFYLKTFPSFTGRWTISHRAVNVQSLGVERSVTGRWTMARWRFEDGKMEIREQQDVHLWTAHTKSTKRCSGSGGAWASWHSAEPTNW